MAHKTKITYSLGVVRRVHSLPVEEETNTRDVLALTVAERIHEFLELGSPLNLEEDLVVVIRHLDVEVFRLASVLRLLHIVGASVVGHGCGEWGSKVVGDIGLLRAQRTWVSGGQLLCGMWWELCETNKRAGKR